MEEEKILKFAQAAFFLDQNELALHKIFVSTKLIADKQIRTLPEVLKWTNRNCAHERQELGHQRGRRRQSKSHHDEENGKQKEKLKTLLGKFKIIFTSNRHRMSQKKRKEKCSRSYLSKRVM